MIKGQVDLDPFGIAADFELDAARAPDPARGGNDTGDRHPLRHQLDVVRPEEELRAPLGRIGAASPMTRPPTQSSPLSTSTGSALDSPMKPKTNGLSGVS